MSGVLWLIFAHPTRRREFLAPIYGEALQGCHFLLAWRDAKASASSPNAAVREAKAILGRFYDGKHPLLVAPPAALAAARKAVKSNDPRALDDLAARIGGSLEVLAAEYDRQQRAAEEDAAAKKKQE